MKPRTPFLAGTAAVAGASLWWRRHPSACPYGQRFWLAPPRPFITRARLREALRPLPGERLLEVGVGTGHYALDVAAALVPGGRLDVLDLQPAMLDHTMRRARAAGFGAIVPQQGDATALPYEDQSFDGAYLVSVLGEVPDRPAALRQLARVLRPGGRLVVGEIAGDPHMVRAPVLRREAAAAGLALEARLGPPAAYFARLRRG